MPREVGSRRAGAPGRGVHRPELVRALVARGHDVGAPAPTAASAQGQELGPLGSPPSCYLYADMDARTCQVRGEWHQTWNQRQTWQHLKGVIRRYAGQGVRALVILWDNAPWHVAAWLHRLLTRYNRWAKRHGRLRVLLFALPRKAPWLMPLEAVFRQTKRAVGPQPHASLAALRGAVDRRLERRNAWVDQQRRTHGQTHSFERE